MIVADFVALGLPTPQGSKSAVIMAGRPQVIDGGTPKARRDHKAWRKAVDAAARGWIADNEPWLPLDEPCKVRLHFLFAPKQTQPYRVMHAVAPDVDKLIRSVLDSLVSSGLLRDDSRVSQVDAIKEYGEPDDAPGCHITVYALGRVEATLSSARRSALRSP